MFAPERISIIKSYLRDRGQLDVHGISGMLNVSEVTIRRDLEKLEAEGFLQRIHGGAMLSTGENAATYVQSVAIDGEERARQEEIARIALFMVSDGDVVFLLNGPINLVLAHRIAERNGVTVLTNDIRIALEIAGQPRNKSVLVGGNLDCESRALFGSLALANLRNFFVKRIFVELDAINEQLQFSVASQEKADLILEAARCTEEKVVLCSAENFGKNAFCRLSGIEFADKIITNTNIADDYKRRIFEHDTQLYTSINAFEGST